MALLNYELDVQYIRITAPLDVRERHREADRNLGEVIKIIYGQGVQTNCWPDSGGRKPRTGLGSPK